MKSFFRCGAIVALLALVTGCANLGYEKATDPTHGVAYARAELTTSYEVIGNLVKSGDMDVAGRDAAVAWVDRAAQLIDATEIAADATTRASPQDIADEVVKWVQNSYFAWSRANENTKFVSNLIALNKGGALNADQVAMVKGRMEAARAEAVK